MVINTDNIVLGGNMRLKALKELGYKEIPDKWVKRAEDLTDEEQRRFIIADNVGFGEHDWEMLANEWDSEELGEWGLDIPNWSLGVEQNSMNDEDVSHIKLEDRFIIPPFSILDTRQGYWQKRKTYWHELIGDNGESREGTLYKSLSGNDTVYYKNKEKIEKKLGRKLSNIEYNENYYIPGNSKRILSGVSLLDPVLAELSNKWFGLEKCKTFDCFAGDSVFGYVSSYLGNKFTGIELREEQVKLNNERIIDYKESKYICDDGQNVLTHIEPNSQDLLFSCPPYFDLEVYSDLKNDASNQKNYDDFIKILENAFTNAIKCLKEDRFAFIVVGDVRSKKDSNYLLFPDAIKNIFIKNNCGLYSDMILVESLGNAAMRAVKQFGVYRKPVKCHQNVLVFYKGNTKNIKNIFPKLDLSEYESTDVQLSDMD